MGYARVKKRGKKIIHCIVITLQLWYLIKKPLKEKYKISGSAQLHDLFGDYIELVHVYNNLGV